MNMPVPPAAIPLGDPVPWFSLNTIAGASCDISVAGGRWVVLCFLNSLADPASRRLLDAMLADKAMFREDHAVFYAILTEPPKDAEALAALSHPALGFMMDYDGKISSLYGALGSSRTIVLDPMLRAIANVSLAEHGENAAKIVSDCLKGLPAVDDHAGVPLFAPALVVPRIFDFSLCDFLINLYDTFGGTDSGFLLDRDGKTETVVNYRLKSRKDLVITHPEAVQAIREQIVRRLVPAMERFFGYRPTRMDRYLVSCYSAEDGGHFSRHRDNVNAGARHRRFAVSINLNKDYEGGDLIFPEFGQRRYRAPHAGGIVFATGALHEVTPVTRGKRYAFIPFFYGEAEAKLRLDNNALLKEGEKHYEGKNDILLPPSE